MNPVAKTIHMLLDSVMSPQLYYSPSVMQKIQKQIVKKIQHVAVNAMTSPRKYFDLAQHRHRCKVPQQHHRPTAMTLRSNNVSSNND